MKLDDVEERIKSSETNNEELARIYVAMLNLETFLSAMKKDIMEHVERNLVESNLIWGECDIATFGITQPTPRSKVDEKAWHSAISFSKELHALDTEYEKARMAYLKDSTQLKRPYIRKKKGVE